MNKPFYWKARKGWYHKVKKADGTRVNVKLDAQNKEQAYAIWMKTKERGQRIAADHTTLGDVIELYVTEMESKVEKGQLAESTLTRRIDDLGCAIAYEPLSGVFISDLKPFHVLAWLQSVPTWGATTQHFAAATVKRAVAWAKEVGRIETNPLETLRVEKGEGRSFLIGQELYETFIEEACRVNRINTKSFTRVLMALRQSGCRPGEVASVNIEDIAEGEHGMTWVIPYHKNRRKKKEPRVVYCNPCLRTLTLLAKGDRKSGPLFLSTWGEGFAYNRMRLRFERMRKRLGVDPACVLYSFRHTSITNMMVDGIDVATVAVLHGTSIQMIQDHYGHLGQHAKFLHDAVNRAAASLSQRQESNSRSEKKSA